MQKNTNKKVVMLGDDAVARGAYEAGVKVAAAYPGTPSTEILEAVAKYKEDIYCEWSVNEKVALEVVLGASMGGVRALYASKHVGVNVAADPLFSAAYIGSRGGLVIVTCDDPGLHSSQNEQDNRYYGISAKIPVLVPSDSQEAKDFTKIAFDISEKFDVPVILRLTTRISHSKSVVTLEPRKEVEHKGYEKNIYKNMILPAFAKKRHYSLEDRLLKLKEFSETFPYNRIEEGDRSIGVIADGVAYNYAKEVFPDATFLKISLVHPLPEKLIKKFASMVDKIYVIEENDPVIEDQVRKMGIEVIGKDVIPRVDELSPGVIRKAVFNVDIPEEVKDIPDRPPALCPGCPHRGFFSQLKKIKNVIITGDIGCYTLGALPPLNAMDTCVCMGGGVTIAHGIEKAIKGVQDNPIVGVVGDSTFFHSGITGLINAVYNKSSYTLAVLDNRITAMTGHQEHPGTGKTLMEEETKEISVEEVAKACGVEKVITVNPHNLKETYEGIKEAVEYPGVSVIISKAPCPLHDRSVWGDVHVVDEEKCIGCKLCIQLGCPAISFDIDNKKAKINEILCIGCTQCAQVCPTEAIYAKKD